MHCAFPKQGIFYSLYMCRLNTLHTNFSLKKDLDPITEHFEDKVELIAGENLILPCIVAGNPDPLVSWFKNNDHLKFDLFETRVFVNENNSLVIQNISQLDSGMYSCRASYKNGKDVRKESQVIVHGSLIFFLYLKIQI